jgi:glycosyltransferase involved in cell wall biosynthesis
MHVLTLSPFYPSERNEVSGCFVAEPLRQLERQNVSSSVLGANPVYHLRKRPSALFPADWVQYPQLPGNLGLSSAGKLLYAWLLKRVQRIHGQNPIDVIHAHAALPCGHAAALLSRKLGIPYVVTVHGLDVFNSCFLGGAPAAWRREISCRVYRDASSVICISRKVQEILSNGMKTEVRSNIVYNGTDPVLFSPQAPLEQHGREILIVGNLLRGKGHELVLRAISRLRSSYPELRCRVIGEGQDRARIAALAAELGIEPQVLFLGRRTRAEVAEAMRGCTVFVLPSCYEGLGCVYLEAMSCAKPVIACHGQGIDEIIEHGKNGWLIPVGGLEELVQGLSTLLDSAAMCTELGLAARQTILSGLTLAHQAQRLARIYTEASA